MILSGLCSFCPPNTALSARIPFQRFDPLVSALLDSLYALPVLPANEEHNHGCLASAHPQHLNSSSTLLAMLGKRAGGIDPSQLMVNAASHTEGPAHHQTVLLLDLADSARQV